MKRSVRYILVVMLLICTLCISACGETIEGWPKDKFIKGVPSVQAGVISGCVVSEDGDGKPYALIKVMGFNINDMSNYMRLLHSKGWEMVYAQEVIGDRVMYSAGKGDKIVHLILNTAKNEFSIEVQKQD